MSHTLLNAVAIPEAENTVVAAAARDPAAQAQELFARVQVIASDLAMQLEEPTAVDWEQDLERGGGPCLALGAERRCAPR
jgi:hypothetical protein